MKESNHTDKIFSSKLKEHAPKAPPHVWDRLDAALPDKAQKQPMHWYYVAASILLLLAIGLTTYLQQNKPSLDQGIALPADTLILPTELQPDLSNLVANNNIPVSSTGKTDKKAAEYISPSPKTRQGKPQALQPSLAREQNTDITPVAVQTATSSDVNQPEPIAKEAVPADKIIIEIRSGYQETILVASSQTAPEVTQPNNKKHKVVRFLKKLKDIKNGDEEIELDDLKQNLFALVPNNERTKENENR